MCVFSYLYMYFDACKLPTCQTRLSGSVLSITTASLIELWLVLLAKLWVIGYSDQVSPYNYPYLHAHFLYILYIRKGLHIHSNNHSGCQGNQVLVKCLGDKGERPGDS